VPASKTQGVSIHDYLPSELDAHFRTDPGIQLVLLDRPACSYKCDVSLSLVQHGVNSFANLLFATACRTKPNCGTISRRREMTFCSAVEVLGILGPGSSDRTDSFPCGSRQWV